MRFWLLLSLLWLPELLPAQTLGDTLHIAEVEVFGRRRSGETGMKVSRPDSLAMAARLTTSLADLLALHSPVFIKSYGRGSQATASFRGTAASHTQILWNGMTLNSPMAGIADLSLLPVFFTDEVTLLHGGSSLSEGSGALGGAIHLENKPQWEETSQLTAITERGSFGSWRLMAGLRTGSRPATRSSANHTTPATSGSFADHATPATSGSFADHATPASSGSSADHATPATSESSVIPAATRDSAMTPANAPVPEPATPAFRWQSVTRLFYDASHNDFPFYNVGVIPFRKDTLRNGGYHRSGLLQEIYLRTPGEMTAALRGWFQQGERDLPQLMSYEGGEREENQIDNQWRLQLELKRYGPGTRLTFRSGLNGSVMRYFRKAMDTGWVIDDAHNQELSWHNSLNITRELASGLTLSGSLDATRHQVEASNQARDEGYRKARNEVGLLVHVWYKPTPRTGFFVLTRSEIYDHRWIPVIPALGAEWQVTPRRQAWLKANLSGNFHKPSMNDLYWIPGGNPDLQPEKGLSGELSWASAYHRKKWAFRHEASFFLSDIHNWIIWQPAANGAWYWEASNLRDVLSRGVEYDFTFSLNYEPWNFILSGNYALTRTTNQNAVSSVDQSRGKQLIYIPLHAGNLHGTLSRQGWSLQSDLGYTGRRYTRSSNEWSWFESRLNPFWLLDLSLIKHFDTAHHHFGVKVKVENIAGVRYSKSFGAPCRAAIIRLPFQQP